MAKLSGKFVKVYLDTTGGAAQDVSADIESIEIPDEYMELDVTGLGQADNSIPGVFMAPVEIVGNMNPTESAGLFAVARWIAGQNSGKTLTVQVGQNAAPTTGDPELEGEFWLQKVALGASAKGKVTLNLSLRVYGSTAPVWGTVS